MGKVVIAGGGVLGSQIAFQTAYCGFDVTIWLRSESSIGRTQPKLDSVYKSYLESLSKMNQPGSEDTPDWCRGLADKGDFDYEACVAKTEAAYKNIKLELDMKKAVEGADLIIESMAEEVQAKTEFYQKLAPLMDPDTILVTNSSSLLPSQFAAVTGRPEKYLALHFANTIWKNNTAEVMSHAGTEQKYFDAVMKFASDIRMIPLPVKKEKAGYLLNSQLIPLLFSGMDLYVNGVSDPESIDIAWKMGTGAPKGPFEILDTVGINTAHNIVAAYAKKTRFLPKALTPYNFKAMEEMLQKMIDAGKLGKSSGE